MIISHVHQPHDDNAAKEGYKLENLQLFCINFFIG